MAERFPEFDRRRLEVLPLAERRHDLDLSALLPLERTAVVDPSLRSVAARVQAARESGASVVLMMGAHVLRAGVQRFLLDLMERGFLSCVAVNGAGVIHDYELARVGATTESVSAYIRDGRFGLWAETGEINDWVAAAAREGLGLGEGVGRAIEAGGPDQFPNRDVSLLAAGYRLGIPVTAHVAIGCDIVHELPSCDGAAYGAASYRDFLRFAAVLEGLEGGVVMNFGSAVMAPEVYLKALSMVRNVARQEGRSVADFTTLVCDLVELPDAYRTEARKDDPFYYFRPWKTMLVRTVADGGRSYYVRGHHRQTVPQLWTAVQELSREAKEDRP